MDQTAAKTEFSSSTPLGVHAPNRTRASEVVTFWREAGPKAWFSKDLDFDKRFRDRFLDLHLACARRECDAWLDAPESALALILLLDQFPRNAFRGTPHMFGTDPLAREYANKVIEAKHDQATPESMRAFLYLPFEHAESMEDQIRSVELVTALGGNWVQYAIEHRDIIAKFGRFPHRNIILGRDTTPQEAEFLQAGGFAG